MTEHEVVGHDEWIEARRVLQRGRKRLPHVSAYARGIDLLNAAYNYLDLVPKGRDEDGQGQYWVRLRDEYAG